MISVNDFDLLSGQPFSILGIGTFRAPKLKDLFSHSGIGLEKYNMMLSLLSMNVDELVKSIGFDEKYSLLPPEAREIFTPFRIIASVQVYQELLCEALDFFMLENAIFDSTLERFTILNCNGTAISFIDGSNYDDLRAILLKANCLSVSSISTPKKFRDKRAKSIFEKIQAARQHRASTAPDESLSLWNVISSVSARHNSYNLLNIWDLTVYQLYDQFSKINLNHQIDVSALRWAAWGQDPFDFSLWYKSMKNKEDMNEH